LSSTPELTRAFSPHVWTALDLSPDGLLLLDMQGQIVEMNAMARRLLCCADHESSGRDFWDAVLPELADKYQLAMLDAANRQEPYSFVAHSEFEGDTLEYTFRPCPAGSVVSVKDVTPAQGLRLLLADSQSTNQLLFRANPVAMWVCDLATLCVLDANPAAIMFYGMSKRCFLALEVGALFPDGSGAALFSAIRNTGAGNIALQICNQVKGDGTVTLVELASSRILWHGQEAALVSLADVAERHIADRDLRRENTQLKQTLADLDDELKGARRDASAFAYALSHDLQTPLHAANGFASLLGDKYGPALDDAGRHYISRIQASTRKMAGLVDDLRTLVQLPHLACELQALDVGMLCAPIVRDLRTRNPSLVVTFDLKSESCIRANQRMLVIALTCLLENAWKFTSKKTDAWIEVAVIAGQKPNELILQVSDNGAGFDAAYTDKLFMAFQRLHSSADYPGHGLGLVTVKRVAERHGGRVWATSTPSGASFFMALPQS
jgi:signal transduction histidine kinase